MSAALELDELSGRTVNAAVLGATAKASAEDTKVYLPQNRLDADGKDPYAQFIDRYPGVIEEQELADGRAIYIARVNNF